jgi:hypothetical protein
MAHPGGALLIAAIAFGTGGARTAMALRPMMLAATDGILPGTTWLYFAFSQFPIYLTPQLLKPIVKRLSKRVNQASP